MNGDKFWYLIDTNIGFMLCVTVLLMALLIALLVSLILTYGLSLVVPLAYVVYIWKKEPNDDT